MIVNNAPYSALSLKNREGQIKYTLEEHSWKIFLSKTGPYLELVDASHHLNALLVVMSVRP